MNERKCYKYQFAFLNENDDVVLHQEEREVTDEFNAASYCIDCLAHYETKFGRCFHVIVYEAENPINILLNIKRYISRLTFF